MADKTPENEDIEAHEGMEGTQERSEEKPDGRRGGKKDKSAKGSKADRPGKDDRAVLKEEPAKLRGGLPTPAWVVIAVACLVAGVLCGHFVLSGALAGMTGSKISGATTLSESGLDDVMGTYTYNGQTYSITARDVISQRSSLSAAANDDGSYNVPAADGALAVARAKILMLDAQNRGINVSDDDISAYAQNTLGTSDYSTIASSYGMDVDTVKELLRQSAIMSQLRSQVVTAETPTAPTAPATPADGAESTPTADYAQYIIALAGDEWDAANNTWSAADGKYATALADYTISNDSATYEAAQAAYYVAYQNYSTAQSQLAAQWTNYVNGLLCNATINISTLVA